MTGAQAALERLCAPEAEVSAHYLIGRDGTLWQLVEEDRRAWHAGTGTWAGRGDVNSRSIGIELDNSGLAPFTAPLMDRLTWLISDIRARWSIPPAGVIGHSDFAPTRKADPGRRFDWRRLALEGQSVWPAGTDAAGTVTEAAFMEAAAAFGYPSDEGCKVVLDAFRQRFRPGAHGPLEGEDLAQITDLARRFPVDRATPAP
jgi:N-acetylmuramoyl-L-alanine amidase